LSADDGRFVENSFPVKAIAASSAQDEHYQGEWYDERTVFRLALRQGESGEIIATVTERVKASSVFSYRRLDC
jgi:hypothetical protein